MLPARRSSIRSLTTVELADIEECFSASGAWVVRDGDPANENSLHGELAATLLGISSAWPLDDATMATAQQYCKVPEGEAGAYEFGAKAKALQPLVVGIVGGPLTGKSTLAHALATKYGLGLVDGARLLAEHVEEARLLAEHVEEVHESLRMGEAEFDQIVLRGLGL